jgi:hypothetical protein
VCSFDKCFQDEYFDGVLNKCINCQIKFPQSAQCNSLKALTCVPGYKLDTSNTYCIIDSIVTNCDGNVIIPSPFYHGLPSIKGLSYKYF